MLLGIRDCSGDEREAAGCLYVSVCGRGGGGGGTDVFRAKKNGGWRSSKKVDLFLTIYRKGKNSILTP